MTKNQPTEQGILEELFGGVSAKILDFLTVHRDWDYSKQDIAKNSNTSLRHAINAIEKLTEKGLLKHTRKIGNNQMYQYNTDNPTAMKLQEFTLDQAFYECEKIGTQEQAKHEVTRITQQTEKPTIPQSKQNNNTAQPTIFRFKTTNLNNFHTILYTR